MDQLHLINSLVCFAIGSLLNITLLALVYRRVGGKDLRVYSHILAQTAVLDLCSLVVSVTGQPLYLSRGSVAVTAVVGVLVQEGGEGDEGHRRWNYALTMLYTFVTSAAVYSIPVQFYYRYTVLKK
jgi:Serpentine type 7TM GPCR chemoreceptor Srd